jgi:hypothetical protein
MIVIDRKPGSALIRRVTSDVGNVRVISGH